MTITSDPSAQLIFVIGATGNQGGSLINALEASPIPYRIRGLTRDTSKAKAQALKNRGVDVRAGNLSQLDEGCKNALEGVDIVFLVTNYWEHLSKEKEFLEGSNFLKHVATSPTVHTIIWSGLENVETGSNGKFKNVYHFDGKGQVTEFGYKLFPPSSSPPSPKSKKFVYVPAGLYMSNFSPDGGSGLHPQNIGNDTFALMMPMSPNAIVPMIDVEEDYGIWVRAVIEGKYEGNEVLTYGELITAQQMADQIAEVTGKKVIYKQLTPEEYLGGAKANGTPDAIALEMLEMVQWFEEFGYYGKKPYPPKDGLSREPRTWKQFVEFKKEIFVKALV